ncbi:Glycoside hydrolase family 2 protein [Mycena indigotica]|uniref:Beta-mannosidase B n=1 Tax=Mycena indigotica TaxID=2126181 RepID=A0A8H6SN03_9AGAR|nr:Glycoside hydrolase family 2 protein [Mycena indigotica]KAF7301631.1 Glycoside hydrolase family 2 protein [Mycena indigotica]
MHQLLKDWKFTQIGGGKGTKEGEWLPVSTFPTTVHVELLKLKKIPDPFLGLAEWDVQWVGESKWAFKTDFVVEPTKAANVDLVFEGLDTFSAILLNGVELIKTNNQFVSYRVPVKDHLKEGGNELVINFDSAFVTGRAIEKAHEKLNLWNGDSSRLHVRKAQYNYGWDWGPILMTTGPWKPISIHTYDNRITDADIRAQVTDSLAANLSATFSFSGEQEAFASFVLKGPDGSTEFSDDKPARSLQDGRVDISISFPEGKIKLWYPVNYGEQPIYTAELTVLDAAGNVLDSIVQKIGFRNVKVVEEPLVDQEGLTFLFQVNGVRIFCGGSNWIPADSFLTTVTEDRYRAWLQLLVDGNQNMIRVWGGGIYEADAFYEICDELGILVWQDFMFGCGQYPAYESFLESVQTEAEQNVRRLRHHPSIVIFGPAGNNEDYQIAESLKLDLDYSDETSDYRQTNFPARHIYERVLPSVVNGLSDIYYHRGSPYRCGKPPNFYLRLINNFQRPWESNYRQDAGRPSSMECLAWVVPKSPGTTGIFSPVDSSRNLAWRRIQIFERSIIGSMEIPRRDSRSHGRLPITTRQMGSSEDWRQLYLVENFKHSFNMDSYVYYTQIMQAETLASAYRLWRRNWAGPGKQYTAGALVWQINDCWPVTSWSIVDYFLRPKPSYFAIARELRPFTVGMTRKESKIFPDELSAQFTINTVLEIWGTNSTLAPKQVTLEVTSFDLENDNWRDRWITDALLQPNSSTELFKGPLPGQPPRTRSSQVPRPIVVSARLIDRDGNVLGRYSNWPEPFKFINFPADTAIKVEVDGEQVTLSTNRPVKGVVLDVEGTDVKWSDQAVDLVPGDPQQIRARGLDGRKVLLRYLGDGSA